MHVLNKTRFHEVKKKKKKRNLRMNLRRNRQFKVWESCSNRRVGNGVVHMSSASIVERVWFPLTLTNQSLRCTILAISRAMNNSADSDSPDTDHACVVGVGVGFGFGVGVAASSSSSSVTRTRNPRKKRTKLITIMDDHSVAVKAKPYKRPDPDAPKITRPCTECGKQFWSWKALFGHMRCHPERQWRGINPPPNLRRQQQQPPQREQQVQVRDTTQEDHEVAVCLLLLASGRERVINEYGSGSGTVHVQVDKDVEGGSQEQQQERFECSSCKKVFGSHQALGGHRASHKNVKGCFAITRTDGDHASTSYAPDDDHININMMTMIHGGAGASTAVDDGGGHKCSICLRVFSTGQALGGHKRCHWEKADTDPSMAAPAPAPAPAPWEGCVPVDLNLPAPPEDHCSSSPLTLDLRLGL